MSIKNRIDATMQKQEPTIRDRWNREKQNIKTNSAERAAEARRQFDELNNAWEASFTPEMEAKIEAEKAKWS